jgi:hypothetical protein
METASHFAVEKIPSLLENPKVNYTVKKSPTLGINISQISPVQTHPICSKYILILFTYLHIELDLRSGVFRSIVRTLCATAVSRALAA